jgi:hypothetical protein
MDIGWVVMDVFSILHLKLNSDRHLKALPPEVLGNLMGKRKQDGMEAELNPTSIHGRWE